MLEGLRIDELNDLLLFLKGEVAPKFRDRLIIIIEQRGTAKAAFDAFDGHLIALLNPQ